ncbi:MAG: sulfotransferase [Chloroflexota bacterium]
MLMQNRLPFPLNAMNRGGELINRLGLAIPRLEVKDIQQRAMRATGLSNFGDTHYVAGLEALLDAAKHDELNYFGRLIIDALSLDYAKMRLDWVEMQKRQPEAFAIDLLPPIIVTGLPRTGTTLLHNLLAVDPVNQAIPLWRLFKPFPPLHGRRDNRHRLIAQNQKMMDWGRPNLASKHAMTIDSPEECIIVQGLSFNSVVFYISAPVYSYLDWFLTAERSKMYQEYASMLHWYQAHDNRRLVMKAPPHMSELSELLTAVPNALIVQTHRDPVQAINSMNSLFHTLHSSFMKPYVPEKMVKANLRLATMFTEGNLNSRDKIDHNICDVFYDDLVNNPQGTVQKIYAHFGLEWTDAYAHELKQYMADNPQGKHGSHQHDSADFGIRDAQIRERFSTYIEQYHL